MKKYINVPLDPETHQKLMALCVTYELGARAQGVMVRKLVNAEYQKLSSVKLVAQVTVAANMSEVKE